MAALEPVGEWGDALDAAVDKLAGMMRLTSELPAEGGSGGGSGGSGGSAGTSTAVGGGEAAPSRGGAAHGGGGGGSAEDDGAEAAPAYGAVGVKASAFIERCGAGGGQPPGLSFVQPRSAKPAARCNRRRGSTHRLASHRLTSHLPPHPITVHPDSYSRV